MAKDNISQYSTTAASNTDVGGVNINEDCLPSNLNNAIRELMSHLADLNAGNTSLGTVKVDNLQLDLNTISSTDTNGNINITPNGTGSVVIDGLSFPQADGTADQILKTNGSGHIVFGDAPASGGFSLGTALTGTTPTIDWSSATAFSQTLTGDTTYSFSNVPSGGEIELYLKQVGLKDDYLQLTDGYESSESPWTGLPSSSDIWWIESFTFSNDGTKVWAIVYRSVGYYAAYAFDLSTAYDFSTATYDTGNYNDQLNTSSLADAAQSQGAFNSNGTKYISRGTTGSSYIKNYNVGTAYDITTWSNSGTDVNLATYFNDGGYSSTSQRVQTVKFNGDGTSIFITGQYTRSHTLSSYACNPLMKINLATAYDITSTKTLAQTWDKTVTDAGLSTNLDIGDGSGITDDGTFILICDRLGNNGYVYVWQLTTPYDLDTSTYKGRGIYTSQSTSTRTYYPHNICSTSSSGRMYLFDRPTASANNGGDFAQADQFATTTDYQATFPSSVNSQISTNFGTGADPATTSYLRMVSLDGTNVLLTDEKEIQ